MFVSSDPVSFIISRPTLNLAEPSLLVGRSLKIVARAAFSLAKAVFQFAVLSTTNRTLGRLLLLTPGLM